MKSAVPRESKPHRRYAFLLLVFVAGLLASLIEPTIFAGDTFMSVVQAMRRWLTGLRHPELAVYAATVALYVPNWLIAVIAAVIIGRNVGRNRWITLLLFWLGLTAPGLYFTFDVGGNSASVIVMALCGDLFGLGLAAVAMLIATRRRPTRGFEVEPAETGSSTRDDSDSFSDH